MAVEVVLVVAAALGQLAEREASVQVLPDILVDRLDDGGQVAFVVRADDDAFLFLVGGVLGAGHERQRFQKQGVAHALVAQLPAHALADDPGEDVEKAPASGAEVAGNAANQVQSLLVLDVELCLQRLHALASGDEMVGRSLFHHYHVAIMD